MAKLLFGVSDTEECRRAIKTIIKLFGHRDEVELTLLHVTPEVLVYAESGIVDYGTIENIEQEKSNEILDEFDHTFKAEGILCKKILRTGNPIDVVLEIAHQFDLLVIGASESSLLHRIFNSHQNSFINSSPIPVLVAK
ncbi:universal stress protein [Helicobacter fennelliae]|uniref:UspA domain-containing protein n=2 Tax=Helicobacter fennelliae TaxID=215 RepID=T1DV12_9HELI|nr:universal stress protein [Helicobacter fennelliae]SQB98058.1 UspA domain-containing protein [Helicobacter fennelliae]SQC36322.1 UspA domain-containing protein [Helicobacter fennelliae]SQC36328.1 UspA domain-containing protein [Helicobacter fennelliae]STP06731.1 UspA domain-containing protein [Helicobacter fennelliae]STQ83712.1 UspA domain-containing protein [Helicobacter fennelliae]